MRRAPENHVVSPGIWDLRTEGELFAAAGEGGIWDSLSFQELAR